MAEKRNFLGVRQSANGIAWRPRLDERGERRALALAQSTAISETIARVLIGRSVPPEKADIFLHPTLRDLLPDPSSLTDMDKAADRLADAVLRKEPVAVFGDYDVDGASSSALMHRFLRHYGVSSEIYIPDRIFEGYGPNPAAMRTLVERGAKLIVTVDCGTNSQESISTANELGVDVVVLDHHQVSGALPAAVAVVNPNRHDDLSGQGHLCAAGVVFLTLVRTRRVLAERLPSAEPVNLMQMLDLVALATVCDVVPLLGVNRAFVRRGLDVIAGGANLGLAALGRVSRLSERVNAYHLGFLLGPRINAGGRIGDAALGSRLLATEDAGEADRIAFTLEGLNKERQELEAVMLAEARAEADAELIGDGPGVLVTGSERWHPGVVGLLASRLKDHARRPAFAIAFNPQGVGTGSGRSISGIDLGGLVRRAVETGLLEKGGGHAMAAGITVRREKLRDLRAFFEAEAAAAVKKIRAEEALLIDAAVSAEGANLALLDEIEQAGPYGSGHPSPTFALPRHRIADMRVVGANHVQLQLSSQSGGRIKAMAFRAADSELGQFFRTHMGRPLHFAGSLSANYWNGARRAEFRVSDAALSE